MRRYWLFFLLFVAARYATGQTFFPVPDPVLEKELVPEQANECYLFLENPGGDTLQLRWKRMETSFPAEWDIDLCDLGACYVGIPAGALMAPASDTIRPYLKLIVQPGNTAGSGWLWFRVWEDGNPGNAQDVFFSVYTTGTTNTREVRTKPVRLFPNPGTGPVFLENTRQETTPVQLRDASGRLLWSGELLPLETRSIDLSNYPAGPYFLQTNYTTQTILRAN